MSAVREVTTGREETPVSIHEVMIAVSRLPAPTEAGWTDVRIVPKAGPLPLTFVAGRRG